VSSSLGQRAAGSWTGELRLPARAQDLGAARDFVERAASSFGLDAEGGFELVLAANEAITNAIRHGSADEQGRILLFTLADGDRLTLVVRDYGTFTSSHSSPMRPDGGRGLAMMGALTDHFELLTDSRGTTVHLSKDRR
jgi:serine/threonine-protein kinase RsbW